MSDLHPLDFDALQKGDVIPRLRLERIFNIDADEEPEKFRFAVMGLGNEIEHRRPGLLYRCEGHDLRIMTDAEAEERTHVRIEHSFRSIVRNTERRAHIDRTDFDSVQTQQAEARDRAHSAIVLAGHKARKNLVQEVKLFKTKKEAG